MNECPEPDICKAGDACAGRCKRKTSPAPPGVQQAHHDYLIMLRDSGAVNMWGASPYLEQQFQLSRAEAKDVLLAWIKGLS